MMAESPDVVIGMRLLDIATRRRKSSLLVTGELLVTGRISGDALNVLNTVISYWPP